MQEQPHCQGPEEKLGNGGEAEGEGGGGARRARRVVKQIRSGERRKLQRREQAKGRREGNQARSGPGEAETGPALWPRSLYCVSRRLNQRRTHRSPASFERPSPRLGEERASAMATLGHTKTQAAQGLQAPTREARVTGWEAAPTEAQLGPAGSPGAAALGWGAAGGGEGAVAVK